jgi:hypothetical protein
MAFASWTSSVRRAMALSRSGAIIGQTGMAKRMSGLGSNLADRARLS